MVAKAKLVEIEFDANQQQFNVVSGGKTVTVHFNPESLKVSFSNQNRGGNQPGGGGGQFVGSGTSKMSVELLFDTTESTADLAQRDVRRITEGVAYFVQAKAPSGGSRNTSSNRVPPGISFEWGTFIFRGVVDSMDETLDYFSEEGVPLRATVSLNITRQEIKFEFGKPGQANDSAASGGSAAPGTQPLAPVQQGDSVQQMAGRQGRSSDWKAIAAANDIDDPLRLQAGALLDLNAGASIGGGISAGAGASVGASAGASAGFGAGAGASIGFGAGTSAGGQVGFSAGLGGGVGFSAGASAGASAGFGAGAGASAGASAGFGAGASAGIGGSAGASAGIGGSASAGFGAGASFGGSAGASAGGSIGFGAGASTGASVSLLEE